MNYIVFKTKLCVFQIKAVNQLYFVDDEEIIWPIKQPIHARCNA